MITVTKADLPPIKKYFKYLEKIWASRWLTNDGEFVQLLEIKTTLLTLIMFTVKVVACVLMYAKSKQ